MKIEFTELIIGQVRTVLVMLCAGVVTESLWQMKKRLQAAVKTVFFDALFWISAAVTVSMFLYYCDFGKVTVHAALAFFTGLLLWKKICCGIINDVWVENEEAENLKTTAKLSASKRLENKGWPKGRQRRKKKKNV